MIARALLSEPSSAAPAAPRLPETAPLVEPVARDPRRRRRRESAAAGTIEAAADELVTQLGPEDMLTLLVCGAGSPLALAAALAAARRLVRDGSCVLVDLGASQSWLADAIDRSDEPAGELAGLSDLLGAQAEIRGDPSSRSVVGGRDRAARAPARSKPSNCRR